VTEGEPTLGGMCYNNVVMWGLVTEDVALLDVRSSTLDLSLVHLPCKVLVQHCVETVGITEV
jgi:hypothetical protein